MGASWGKIAYPGVNPRTGAQVNWLPALTAPALAQKTSQRDKSHALFLWEENNSYNTTGWRGKSTYLLSHINLHPVFLCHRHMIQILTYMLTYSSHCYLYDTDLRGIPLRCEECDGIIGSRGLPPPITQQSSLVLIFVWKKHPRWKWCRKQQVAHQATWANPGALECVHSLAFINTNTHLCLEGSCTHSMKPLVFSKGSVDSDQ